MKDIRIGEQTFNIVRAYKYREVITFNVFDKNDRTKKEYKLAFREKNNGEYVLIFSGYEFSCHKKGIITLTTSGDLSVKSNI